MDIYVAPEIDGFLMRAKVQKPTVRSLEKNEIDLNQFLEFTLLIADKELVVDPTYYGFEVEIVSFTADQVELRFEFDFPLMISRGPIPDEMLIKFVDTSLFVSQENGETLPEGLELRFTLPKQFPDPDVEANVETIVQTSIIATGTALITQVLISLTIKVPLAMMWNLLSVMQVVAYMRLFANWSTNIKLPLDYLWEAITMSKLTNEIMTIFKSKYQKVQENVQNKTAQFAGI